MANETGSEFNSFTITSKDALIELKCVAAPSKVGNEPK